MLLISGRTVNDSEVEREQDSQGYWRFSINGQDITNDIKRSDKLRMIPNFDVEKENIRLSEELGAQSGLGSEPLDESTTSVLIDQIKNDGILAAPLASLDATVKQLWASAGFRTIVIVGGLVVVAVILAKRKP